MDFLTKKNISALAGLKIDVNGKILHPHRGYFNFGNVFNGIVKSFNETKIVKEYIEIDHASFVGILVSRKAIKQIGFPKKEFFIHFDDVEYCIRLRKIGKILLVPNSIIIHKDAGIQGIEKSFLGKKILRIPFDRYWLNYYGRRNLVWLGKRYSINKINFYLEFVKSILKSILGILIFDDNKTKRINFIINAYLDGIKGIFDNEKPKRLLYKGR